MAKLTKLERSQKAHKKLHDFYKQKSNKTSCSTSENFFASVKKRYHEWIYKSQERSKRIKTKEDKREIYLDSISKEVDNRTYENNYGCGANYYIPKKYR